MAFDVKDWLNGPAGGTRINGVSLRDLEQRLSDYTDDEIAVLQALIDGLDVTPADGSITSAMIADGTIQVGDLDFAPMDAAGVKGLLAALLSGDKIKWAGGNVELWGEATVAGYNTIHADLVSADTSAQYVDTVSGTPLPAGYLTWTAGDYFVGGTDALEHFIQNSTWPEADTGDFKYVAKVQIQGMNALGATQMVGLAAVNAAGQMIKLRVQSDDSPASPWDHAPPKLWVNGVNRGNIGDYAASTWVWMLMQRVANQITVQLWATDPELGGAPTTSVVYNLTAGAEQTMFGAGVGLKPAWIARRGVGQPPPFLSELRQKSSQPESRDLMLAITPAGGVRTVKRIMGSLGAAFRSDIGELPDIRSVGAAGGPAFLNGWINAGGPTKIWKQSGIVHSGPMMLNGSAKTGDSPFAFPTGWGPTGQQYVRASSQPLAYNSLQQNEVQVTGPADAAPGSVRVLASDESSPSAASVRYLFLPTMAWPVT